MSSEGFLLRWTAAELAVFGGLGAILFVNDAWDLTGLGVGGFGPTQSVIHDGILEAMRWIFLPAFLVNLGAFLFMLGALCRARPAEARPTSPARLLNGMLVILVIAVMSIELVTETAA